MSGSWTFTRRIGAALVASWGAALAILVASLLAVRSVHLGNESLQRELILQELEVDRLSKSFHAKVLHGRSFALTRETLFEEQMAADREAFLATAERLRPQLLENPGARLLEVLVHAEREHEEAMQRWLWGQPRSLGRREADALLREQLGPVRADVEAALEKLARYSDVRLVQNFEQELLDDRRALRFILTAAVLGMLGMMTLAWVLVRKVRPLHREAQDSEQRFRLLVEGVQDYALYLVDAQGRVASWNPGAERIKGWKAEEVLGRPTSIFYTPEGVAAGEPVRELARAERDGSLRTEGWRVRKDGTPFWAEVIYNTLRDERGALKGYAKVLRDVTERRRAMRTQHLFAEAGRIFNQLLDPDRTADELMRLIVPEVADGCLLFMVEPGQGLRLRAVVHASAEKEQLLRVLMERHPPPPDASYGSSWVVRTGRSERIEKMADKVLGRVARDDEHLRTLRQLELTSVLTVPLTVGEQTLGALTLLSSRPERLFTMSDQVFMEELAGRLALALDNARLFQEAQQALELIGIASHDLGNPLNALQLLLARLRRLEPEREPQRVREGLAAALRHSQRLGQLLHNLLDLSRLSSGKLTLEVSRVELTGMVREVVERHAEQAHEAGCEVTFEADEAIEGWWDRLRLERVVTNLLSNALKFGRGKPVEVRLEQVDGHVRLTVRDHGPGIPLEAQRRIFERFEREKSTSRQAGFGLGLYIVRQLVEAHGGTIRVESTPGEGAAFTVELPKSRHVGEEPEPRSSHEPH
ncbi:sensor histidine kinase [Hyalangium minutum]|uniref:histidine kinase n=1 Tax=Hyalangium minutum TaxID=394096 RepID=A0A085WLD0_9BACT|nr:ATP-binding protein [Hyalangium minutum]KFE68493.1 sensory box histidine kinase/response regulator [Hyalangium minutum]